MTVFEKKLLFYLSLIIDLLGQIDKGVGEKNPYKITRVKIVEYE